MTADEFRECLDALWLSQKRFADLIECDDREVRRWAAGSRDIPAPVAAWLRALRVEHDARPPPVDWRKREQRLGAVAA